MQALTNQQVSSPGWYWFEPASPSIGNYAKFYHIEDDSDLTWVQRGRPKSNIGTWYGPLSIEQIKDPNVELLTTYQQQSPEQRAVRVYCNGSTGEYSCYPALDAQPRTISVALLDAPQWIADTLNKLRPILPGPLK